jgi:hypothetical protein
VFEFVARPEPVRQALLTLGSAAFVLIGAWIAGLFGTAPPDAPQWAGWAGIVFFGLTGIVSARRMLDREDMVRIGAPGVWYRLWSDDVIPWSEIADVGVWEYRGQKTIVLKLQHPERFPSATMMGKFAAANRALTGGDVAIMMLGTDKSFDDAMQAIASCRR